MNPNSYTVLEHPNWATDYITIHTYQIGEKWYSKRTIIFNNFGESGFDSPPCETEKE